jgi:hypothetical protein
MSSGEAMKDVSFACGAARSSAREALIVVVMLYGLTQGAEALADDSSANVVRDIQPIVGGTALSPSFLPNIRASNQPQFSASEFSARKGSVPQALPVETETLQTEPLHSTSAWQRLADYRAQGRVQLLTLWESKGSTISLQAGHHGGPSLQWSSRVMNRGGATRGLLDRFVASSLGAAGLGSKVLAHGSTPAASKTINLLPATKLP